ncbi:neurochondrin-like [Anneissia japonica]|uniref:neurochondrin-like n=1 Tax=Anneissia japonica TaxID=1529436 RepID=UPI0014256DAE|nr:neurochondrin-like [Anneissia japonica]
MATGGEIPDESIAVSQIDDPAVQKCLHMIKSASSDTEKFAALLLITKLVQAESTTAETRNQIFHAVGFSFLNRLLNTKEATAGCDVTTFHSIALTMLACYSTDEQFILHPEMLNKIPLFNNIITGNSALCEGDGGLAILDDVYQIFYSLVNSPTGREYLVQYNTFTALCTAITRNVKGAEKAFKVLIYLFHLGGRLAWLREQDSFVQFLENLSKEFADSQELLKFELCDKLSLILEYSGSIVDFPLSWRNNVFRGVSDLLRNKLNESQRDSQLTLIAGMVQTCGVEWALGPTKDDTKTLLLMVHLVCIEVRMVLENATEEKRREKAGVLSACYKVLENVIEFLMVGPSMGLDQKQTLQLHAAMTGAFGAIIFHLKNVQADPQKVDDPIVQASVRVFSTWLAEETSALKEGVNEILPFLIHISTKSFHEVVTCSSPNVGELDSRTDLLRLLLPGLCHLSVEPIPRKILVEHNCMELLLQYFNYQWQLLKQGKQAEDSEMAIATLCNIFLNITVEEPEIITKRQVFDELFCLILNSLPTLGLDYLVISFNMIVLGMMLLRQFAKHTEFSCSDQLKVFIHTSVQFIVGAYAVVGKGVCEVSEHYQPFWQDIMELWYLGLQVLTACISLVPWLSDVIFETEMINQAAKILCNCKNVQPDLRTLYGAMLSELSKHNASALARIKQLNGMDIARMHKLEELGIILQR